MRISNPPSEIDFECIVDVFIFMCFFVGNDLSHKNFKKIKISTSVIRKADVVS